MSDDEQNDEIEVQLIEDPEGLGETRTEVAEEAGMHTVSGMSVKISKLYIVHGTLTKKTDGEVSGSPEASTNITGSLREEDKLASLLIFLFKSKGKYSKRRFREIVITMRFERNPFKAAELDPWVKCYDPGYNGNRSLGSTSVKHSEESTLSGKLGVSYPPIELEGGYEQTKGSAWKGHEQVKVDAMEFKDETKGGGREGPNIVEWTVSENKREPAFPDTFALGVVLQRPDDANFDVHFDIDAKVDFRYDVNKTWENFKNVFKKAEPAVVRLDPKKQGKKPEKMDPYNLQAVVDGTALNDLIFVHLRENMESKKFYD